MRIGTLARTAGVTVDTLRFYERRGLLPPPARVASAYRDYSKQALERVRYIRDAKALGFTLAEIAELLSLPAAPPEACAALRRHGERKIEELNARIRSLRHMKAVLESRLTDCAARPPETSCPWRLEGGAPSPPGRVGGATREMNEPKPKSNRLQPRRARSV